MTNMANLVPYNSPLAEVNKPDGNKIEAYELSQQVIDMHLNGFRYSKIATKCNETLKARQDGKVYIEINHMNVKQFLEKQQRDIESGKAPLAPLSKKAVDVIGTLESNVLMLQSEIEKLRNPEEPIAEARAITFLRLTKELNKTLELIANVQGKAQPSITLNIFQSGVTRLVDKIMTYGNIPDDTKAELVNWIADELIPSSPLKPVDGKVIEGEQK
jgi:hypothetical protein